MYPSILLCEEYPRAVVQIGNSRLVVELIDKRTGIDIRRAREDEYSSCLLNLPHQGVYHVTSIIEPLKSGDIAYLRVVVELEGSVKVYDFRFYKNKISMYTRLADESILVGYVRREPYHNIVRRLLAKITRSYLLSTTPLCSFLIKMTHRPAINLEKTLIELNPDCATTMLAGKKIKVLYRPGFSIFIRKVGLTRTNVSVVASITYSDKFADHVTILFDSCDTVIDIKFGRVDSINGSISLVLDLFAPSKLTGRVS